MEEHMILETLTKVKLICVCVWLKIQAICSQTNQVQICTSFHKIYQKESGRITLIN
jgi:hypothetical protein